MDQTQSWKTKTMVIGAVVGLVAGLAGAYILVQRAEKLQNQPQLSAGDGVKLGLGLLGVLRLVSDMGQK